jgi:hypothetical protein
MQVTKYNDKRWIEFRKEVISIDKNACTQCGLSKIEGAILQVHHNIYIKGRDPWDYDIRDCKTVCKRCHAEIHGKIMPMKGWEYFSEEDLGDLIGECDKCGQSLRYMFTICHDDWGFLDVGTICCDNLTETKIASDYAIIKKREEAIEKRFVKSVRWIFDCNRHIIKENGINVEIVEWNDKYRIFMNKVGTKNTYNTVEEAKLKAYRAIASGEAKEYLRKRRG